MPVLRDKNLGIKVDLKIFENAGKWRIANSGKKNPDGFRIVHIQNSFCINQKIGRKSWNLCARIPCTFSAKRKEILIPIGSNQCCVIFDWFAGQTAAVFRDGSMLVCEKDNIQKIFIVCDINHCIPNGTLFSAIS